MLSIALIPKLGLVHARRGHQRIVGVADLPGPIANRTTWKSRCDERTRVCSIGDGHLVSY